MLFNDFPFFILSYEFSKSYILFKVITIQIMFTAIYVCINAFFSANYS